MAMNQKDILYYSNYCSYCKKLIGTISKNGIMDNLNFICIDKRSRDPVGGQIFVQLENGKKVMMPPNVHSVPALLKVKQNYSSIFGEQPILAYLEPLLKSKVPQSILQNGEPVGISLAMSSGGVTITSEQYTLFNAAPEELHGKGTGSARQMHNYVSANDEIVGAIPTPPDSYRPDKIGSAVNIESLEQKRNMDIPNMGPPNPYGI